MHDPQPATKTRYHLSNNSACEDFVIEAPNTQHIVILVPGTTDPVNMFENESKDASISYWDGPFLTGMKEFVNEHEIVKYYEEFSWTGDNEIVARKEAAEKLLEFVMSRTLILRNKALPIHLHFICHSHGGNVINEYTHFAAQDAGHSKYIKVRSIVYLSTPFFTRQAQINTHALHEKCAIINVYNKYDLTQRFVANFSMHQMPALVSTFKNDPAFKEKLKKLAETPYLKMILWSQGPDLWRHILDVFNNLYSLLERIDINLNTLSTKYPTFITKEIIAAISGLVLEPMMNDLQGPIKNLDNRLNTKQVSWANSTIKRVLPVQYQSIDVIFGVDDYSQADLNNDIGPGLAKFVDNFNRFLKFKKKDSKNSSGLRSNFSDVIGKILLNQIEAFDDTTHKPDQQFTTPEARKNGQYDITHINVTNIDPYHTCPESKNYSAFINKMEQLEDQYDKSNQKGDEGANIRAEIVFNLLAQENYGVFNILDNLLAAMEIVVTGGTDELIKVTRKTIENYSNKLKERDNEIIHHDLGERTILKSVPFVGKPMDDTYRKIKHNIHDYYFTTPFAEAKGGIPYLAVKSHSVSRGTLLSEVASKWGKGLIMPKKGGRLYSYCIKRAANR